MSIARRFFPAAGAGGGPTNPDFAGGEGTEGNPYRVANATQLDNIRHYGGAHFELIADIDLVAAGITNWEPIRADFVLDGRGHKITNFNSDGTISDRHAGFSDATTQSINIRRLAIYGGDSGIVVSSARYCGYLCVGAFNSPNLVLEDCLAVGKYTTGGDRGTAILGIANQNTTVLRRCVAICEMVDGPGRGGGIYYDYSGSQTVENCFFDADLRGNTDSNGGTPKTSAELELQATYTGFDFVDTWQMGASHAELRVA